MRDLKKRHHFKKEISISFQGKDRKEEMEIFNGFIKKEKRERRLSSWITGYIQGMISRYRFLEEFSASFDILIDSPVFFR